jgi:F-box interacting protein
MSQRRRQSNPSSPSAILPDDLIVEILSLLKVKPLMKMKCVSKSWNTLISDPKFVKMHLNQSSQNSLSYVVSSKNSIQDDDYSFIPFSVNDLMENRSFTFPDDPYYQLADKDGCQVVGSCNGLVCLLGYSLAEDGHKKTCFRFWNPATRTISDKLGYFREDMNLKFWKFTFGYDNSTDTYKVVALHWGYKFIAEEIQVTKELRVFSFGNNIWGNIQSFSAMPLQFVYSSSKEFCGVNLNGTVNWLAVGTGSLFVIISLDLGTETLLQFSSPPGSLEKINAHPNICVLMDSLCFYHDFGKTDIFIWKMTKFGDEKSWIHFLKISYQNLHMNVKHTPYFKLYENGDTLVFTQEHPDEVIFYNWRNSTVVKTIVNKEICWFSINNYVET